MSRAFVKEDGGPEAPPERPVSAGRNLVTRRGLALIDAEIARLREARSGAQAGGDLDAAAFAARDLRYWMQRRASAELVEPVPGEERIALGMAATLEDDEGRQRRFRIVGEDEADPKLGRIGWNAPVSRALLGKWVGDEVELPAGTMKIVAVDPQPEAPPAV
ncbi:GreA/GreB family elongation factor [Ancylobacter sp. A5.8]|uniref:GreA/GreB family elongation factor n=1 Tax=Ancylobacter gelatini TaxID=2919920 RepID=UPI001F4EFFE2|nr:GreA/GreB family elongation factor [Ancylobacter gelatini]MCJ8143246.1 GreA/GreB family elongation factor [Ancylobacter gelatini]